MARPKVHHEKRVSTAIRIPKSLHARLHEAAAERDVSVNLLATRALSEFLETLVSPDELLAARYPRDATARAS